MKSTRRRRRRISLREENIVELLDEHIRGRRYSENFAGRLGDLFREFGERNRKNNARERAAFRRKIAGLEKKKDHLFDALAEGLIDDRVALNGKIIQINSEIESLEQRYKSLNLDADGFLLRAGEVIDRLREEPLTFITRPRF